MLLLGAEERRGSQTFCAHDPMTGSALAPSFTEATTEDVAKACASAEESFDAYRSLPYAKRGYCNRRSLKIRARRDSCTAGRKRRRNHARYAECPPATVASSFDLITRDYCDRRGRLGDKLAITRRAIHFDIHQILKASASQVCRILPLRNTTEEKKQRCGTEHHAFNGRPTHRNRGAHARGAELQWFSRFGTIREAAGLRACGCHGNTQH